MFKWSGLSHRPGAHTESTRSALHIDDRMAAVFPRGCCRQTNNVLGLHLLHNLLKGERRDMVALVDNHLAIVDDKPFTFSLRCRL